MKQTDRFHASLLCMCCWFSEVGRPQISSANRRSTNLRTNKLFFILLDLPQVWQFADLRFADPIFFAICGTNYIGLPQIRKFFIFLLSNIYLKFSNSNFYEIKNSAKPSCGRVLGSFVILGGIFLTRCFIISVLWWKICGFANRGLAQLRNLWICKFCGLVKRNWRMCNLRTRIPQKFADLRLWV